LPVLPAPSAAEGSEAEGLPLSLRAKPAAPMAGGLAWPVPPHVVIPPPLRSRRDGAPFCWMRAVRVPDGVPGKDLLLLLRLCLQGGSPLLQQGEGALQFTLTPEGRSGKKAFNF
jgi:hypothetical protein